MRYFLAAAATVASMMIAGPSMAEPMTDSVRAMVEHAAASGDSVQAAAVARVARELHPESRSEIDAILDRHRAEQEEIRLQALAAAGFLENWRGSGELGGSITTGNSDTTTATAGLSLKKETPQWRYALTARGDIHQNNTGETRERGAVAYQADWKISERLYMKSHIGWERNQAAGLESRFIQSVGLGYRVVDGRRFAWDLEGGPALRQATFLDRTEDGLALNLASNMRWSVTPQTRITQSTNGYVIGDGEGSLSSTTALTSRLVGALSARLSLDLQYESDPPAGQKTTDTITRATLVYDF